MAGLGLSGGGGGSGVLRAQTVNTSVPLSTGLLCTVSTFGLLAPCTFAKSSGSSNLAINTSTGGVSATAALTNGATQSLVGTITSADNVVIPLTVNLTGVAAPTNSVAPSVSGTALFGSVLTVATGTWANSPNFTFQWKAAGVAISGATSSTYTTAAGDIGKAISCDVTGTNAGGSLTVGSSNSVTVSGVFPAPTNTAAPSVIGSTSVGALLTVSNGTWTGSPTFTYQWKAAGVAISGATSTTYTTVSGDAGKAITCDVTATNAGGSLTVGSSNSVTVVSGAPLSISGSLTSANVGDSTAFVPTITGGTTPYTLSVISGALPPGRSILGIQVVGSYTTAGSYSYTLRATDNVGATADLPINVTVGSSVVNQAVVTQAALTSPMADATPPSYSIQGSPSGTIITVDKGRQYQSFLGVGAALTGSSVANLLRLSPANRQQILTDTFGTDGMSMVRISMGASDFEADTNYYTYNDIDTDGSHTNFSIQVDIDRGKIGILQQILAINPNVKIFATPWTPPVYAKIANSWGSNPPLFAGDIDNAKMSWVVTYFIKFIQAYAAQGIPIYAVSPQNEPFNSNGGYPKCGWDSVSAANFIKTFTTQSQAAGLTVKVWGVENDFDHIVSGTKYSDLLYDPTVLPLLDSITSHSYSGDPMMDASFLDQYPTVGRQMTEFRTKIGERDDDGTAMGIIAGNPVVGTLRNGFSSVTLWNYMLDESGNPSNASTGRRGVVTLKNDASAVIKSSSYYILAHLGKYIQAGAKRIKSNSPSVGALAQYPVGTPNNSLPAGNDLETVSFLNPDGSVATFFWNGTSNPITTTLLDNSSGKSTTFSVPAKSIMTAKYNGLGYVALALTGSPVTTANGGDNYSFTPTATGGNGLRTYSINKTGGQLSALGLSFSTVDGSLSSTNLKVGSLTGIVITATDSTGSANLVSFDLTVSVPTSLALDAIGGPSSYPGITTNSASWNHVVASGANLLVVGLAYNELGNTGAEVDLNTAVTAGGVAMTKVNVSRSTGAKNRAVEIWALQNPPTGTVSIGVTWPTPTGTSGGSTIYLIPCSYSFFNAASSALGTLATFTTTTSAGILTPSVTTTSPIGSLIVGLCSFRITTPPSYVGAGQTVRAQALSGTNVYGVHFTQPGGTSVTSSLTFGGTDQAAMIALPIIPATVAPTAPDAPTLGTLTIGNAQVTIPWTDGSNGGASITGHKLYRSTTAGFTPGSGNLVATISTASPYTDSGLTNGTTYYYALSAVNSVGESAPSTLASATPASGATVPAAPTIGTLTAGDTQAQIPWTDGSNGGSAITGHKIYRSTTAGFTPGSGNLLTSITSSSPYTDTGLTNGTTYYYAISAVNAVGESSPSSLGSVTPASPSGTNMVTNPNAFDQWTTVAASITTNVAANPVSGLTTADRLTDTAALGAHSVSSSATGAGTATAGTTYTAAFDVKYETMPYVQIIVNSGQFGSQVYANFDLSTSAAGTHGTACTSAITSLGGGWYRISVTAPCTTTGVIGFNIREVASASSGRGVNMTGTGTNTVLLANAQFVSGSTPNAF